MTTEVTSAQFSFAQDQMNLSENISGVKDYWELTKPRVMSLVIFTSLVALLVAPMNVGLFKGFMILLAVALSAGGSGVLNMAFEYKRDQMMGRTALRPIAAGRILPSDGIAFGLLLSLAALIIMGLTTHWGAALLLAFTSFFYSVVYTLWLKPYTPQNIVIGGLSGALPPLVAWYAAMGNISFVPIYFVALIFIWTPPHFWALAILKKDDYARADFPMFPNVHGNQKTAQAIFWYSVLLVGFSLLAYPAGISSLWFEVGAGVLGGFLVFKAWRLVQIKDDARFNSMAGPLFAYTIIYLFALFGIFLFDCLLIGVTS